MRSTLRNAVFIAVLLTIAVAAPTQTGHSPEVLSIEGFPGEVAVIKLQGRGYVDVQELARVTHGSLRFEKGRSVLTLPRSDSSETSGEKPKRSGFSRPFRGAAIEAMASMREWAGLLMVAVQNGYPVGNNMAGNTIVAYQGRAADRLALAAAAASTDEDYRGLELLRSEYNKGQEWSEKYVQARTSLSAANYTVTEHAFENDLDAQNIVKCGQFLATMFASGTLQEDASCR